MKIARTPGIFSAAAVSSLTTLPLAIVASTGTAYSIPGKGKSEVYCASPLTLRGPSTRGVSRPTGETSGLSSNACMFALPRVKLDCHRHVQCVCKAPLGQFDLESVFAPRFGVAHSRFRRLAKVGRVGGLTNKSSLGLGRPPWFGAHAAEGNASLCHTPGRDRDHNGGRRQREFVRSPIAELQIYLLAPGNRRRERHVRDEIAGLEHRFAAWCATGQNMKVTHRDRT